jgi:uncharacterized membrane protein YdjX (TVP38/TMEM64 family)
VLDVIQDYWRFLLHGIDNLGYLGVVAYLVVYILATVFLIPASLLTLGAGAIYGVIRGTILVSIASTAAATVAFLVGRYLARERVARWIAARGNFSAIDEAVGREGWKIVGLTRLSPLFPFIFLNYAFSITRVSLKDFVLASWVGMLPGTVMFVYIGSLIGDIALLGTIERQRTPIEWFIYGIGLTATVFASLYMTRLARKALESRGS